MSVQLKHRRDTAANVATFTGAQGELIVDLTNNRVTVHDGFTPGGWAAAKMSEVATMTRTPVSDANYTALATDRTIAYTAITAARTVSLPAVSAFPTGASLCVLDESGAATASKTITLNANGYDLINGGGAAAISSAYGYIVLQGNGAASPNGRWTIVDQAASSLANVGVGVAADPNNVVSAYGSSALFNGASFNVVVNKSAAANTASFLFQNGFSGRAQVGLAGDDNLHFKVSSNGSTWTEALVINAASGQASFPQGVAAGDAAAFRNRLRNAAFAINQRNVSGTVTLAAGAYGHDGVRAGASGATYTFATSGIEATLTVTAGSVILPVEGAMIEGGAYMLSQAGTAPARVWQGSGYSGTGGYAAAPLAVSGLSAATQTNIEFSTGTILRPQFEPGSVATRFERRPYSVELALCQRYYQIMKGELWGYGSAGSSPAAYFNFPVTMRAAPTATIAGSSASNMTAYAVDTVSQSGYRVSAAISATGAGSVTGSSITFSAELS